MADWKFVPTEDDKRQIQEGLAYIDWVLKQPRMSFKPDDQLKPMIYGPGEKRPKTVYEQMKENGEITY